MIPNLSQEPPESFKTPNQDLNVDFLFTFKIKIMSQYLGGGCIKDQLTCPNQEQESSDHIVIKIKMQTPVRSLKHPLKPQIRT